jgi:hypothetical protein
LILVDRLSVDALIPDLDRVREILRGAGVQKIFAPQHVQETAARGSLGRQASSQCLLSQPELDG